jgi:hypothetical protein
MITARGWARVRITPRHALSEVDGDVALNSTAGPCFGRSGRILRCFERVSPLFRQIRHLEIQEPSLPTAMLQPGRIGSAGKRSAESARQTPDYTVTIGMQASALVEGGVVEEVVVDVQRQTCP